MESIETCSRWNKAVSWVLSNLMSPTSWLMNSTTVPGTQRSPAPASGLVLYCSFFVVRNRCSDSLNLSSCSKVVCSKYWGGWLDVQTAVACRSTPSTPATFTWQWHVGLQERKGRKTYITETITFLPLRNTSEPGGRASFRLASGCVSKKGEGPKLWQAHTFQIIYIIYCISYIIYYINC